MRKYKIEKVTVLDRVHYQVSREWCFFWTQHQQVVIGWDNYSRRVIYSTYEEALDGAKQWHASSSAMPAVIIQEVAMVLMK